MKLKERHLWSRHGDDEPKINRTIIEVKNVAHTVLDYALADLDKANKSLFEVEQEFPEGDENRNTLFVARCALDKVRSQLRLRKDAIGYAWGDLKKGY
jgi:hypothetical protein